MDFTKFDQLLTPIFITDPKGEILYYNNICSIFFQASPRVLKKFKFLDELIKQNSYSFNKEIVLCAKENIAKTSPEIEFQKQNGELLTVIAKLIPFDNKHILVNILDFSIEKKLHDKYKQQIQELRDTHEQILKADKLTALGEMISGISHEISSPLMIVSNRLELLSDNLEDQNIEESKKLLSELEREFKRVTGIISGMKSFVKNQEESVEVINLDDLVTEVLSFFKELNTKVEITFKNNNLSHAPLVIGNKLKLEQVLINLVKNAIDALQDAETPNPLISISLQDRSEEKSQVILIEDNGPGVPSDIKNKIFDMFFTTKEMTNGTGLGLAISKKIIDAHSGVISINDSEKGAIFEIALPVLELGSFTLTNKYLGGEKDFEDEILLFVSQDVEKLNRVYNYLSDKDYVVVLCNRLQDFADFTEFMMVDKTYLLDATNTELKNEDDVEDYSQKDMDEILKLLGEEL